MPSQSEYESLFLLEFFVDYVTIQNISFDYTDSKLCVCFQFLHYPLMRVCEEDFKPKSKDDVRSEDSKVLFKRGKSCLFSVHPDENNQISSKFNLLVVLYQTKTGCSTRMLIGQAGVNLGNSFFNLLQTSGEPATEINTVQYDVFPLKDKFKRVVGTVAAFARLSNFGKMIITQFQLAAEDNMNYMFKGTDCKKLFKDDPMMDYPLILKDKPKPPQEQDKSKQKVSRPPKKPIKRPVQEETDSSSDEESETESEEELETIKDEAKESQQEVEDENFREIGAEINGHSITIRVVKNKKPKAQPPSLPSTCCCPLPEPPICQFAPKLNTCDCDYPLPPQLVARCPPQCSIQPSQIPFAGDPSTAFPRSPSLPPSFHPPADKTANSFQGAASEVLLSASQDQVNEFQPVCPREDCPLGLYSPSPPPDPMDLEAGCVAMKGDQVFFQMANRPSGEPVNEKEKKLASSIHYTVGATQAGKETMRNVVQITPQSPLGPLVDNTTMDGPVSGLPIDNKHDMFLFKVQKGHDMVSSKNKLEMELRTRKEKEIKPPSNTTDTQYLVTDFPPVERKGKKGKGKGDKDKKKKK